MSDVSRRRLKQAPTGDSYWQTVQRFSAAQKRAARSAPAYSLFVNRKLGRLLAAWAYRQGLSPNALTLISGTFTFTGIALLALVPPSWASGAVVTFLFVVGYAFDSADGQLARLTATGSLAGEWLDHIVDAAKVSAIPVSLAIGFYRFDVVERLWLLVPLGSAVTEALLFFAMILTEQLRRQQGVPAPVSATGSPSRLRALLVLPMDYGVLCLSFLLFGFVPAFLVVYTAIWVATVAFLCAALMKWYRELAAAPTSVLPQSGESHAP